MKFDRLIVSVIVILPVLLPNFAEGWFYRKKPQDGFHGYFYPTAYLVPWMLIPKPSFLTLLLLKLLAVKSTVILAQSAGIGALLIGKGSAMMLGTVAGMTMSQKLRTIQMLKTKYKSDSWHQKPKPSSGWSASSTGNAQLDILRPPYYKLGTKYGNKLSPNQTKSSNRYQNWESDHHKNPLPSSKPINITKSKNDTAIPSSETLLEKQFRQMPFPEAERRQLTLQLEEAEKLKLLMDELKIHPGVGIPQFRPMPEFKTTVRKPNRKNDRNVQNSLKNLISETKVFFTLLSTFDRENCVEKLVCEIHSSNNGAVADKAQPVFYRDVVSMFRLANALLEGDNTETVIKYRNAANYGSKHAHSDACKQRFRSCGYSTRQLMKDASYLENL